MSDSRDPKRPRLDIFDDDLPFDNESIDRAVAIEEKLSTTRNTPNTSWQEEPEPRQQLQSELQQLNKNVDTELLKSISTSKHSSQKAPVRQFRVRVTSDREEAVSTASSVPYSPPIVLPSWDPPATRSQLGYANLMKLLMRNLSLSSTDPLPESQLKLIALDELKKFPESQKISILGSAFEQSTSSLSAMLRKGTEGTTARRSLYSHFTSASTQLNTLESYSLITLLNCYDNHAYYLFTDDIAKRAVTILSTLTQICTDVPRARDLIFAEQKPDSKKILPRRQEIDPKRQTVGGLYYTTKLRELGKNRTRVKTQVPIPFSDYEIFSLTKFQSLGVGLVLKAIECLLHPQINRDVVVACLDLLSALNLYNPGNQLDCLQRVLIDNKLNNAFERENLDVRLVHAIVRFYNTLPLTPLFTHYLTAELFQRFIIFVGNNQKPVRLLFHTKSLILYFLAKTVDMHKQSLVQASINHVSGLSQMILRSKDFSWVDTDDLLLQVRMLFFFLSRDNPKLFINSSKSMKKNAAIKTVKGIKRLREVFANLKAAFALLDIEIMGLGSRQFLIFA